MDKVQKVYERADGAPITDADAVRIGREVEKISNRSGVCTAEALLASASNESSPIHDLFDWDDGEAAQKWRVHQARMIIGYVRIRIVNESTTAEEPTRKVRAFSNVNNDGERGYKPTVECMATQDLREQVLARALSELRSFEAKYAHLRELGFVIDAIRSTLMQPQTQKSTQPDRVVV